MNLNYRFRKKVKYLRFTQVVYPSIILLIIFLVSTLILALNSQSVKDPVRILNQSYENITSEDSYFYTTREESDNYILSFKGNLNRGEITGSIQDHDINIIVKDKELFIKGKNDLWEKVPDSELEELNNFILDPALLLEGVISIDNLSATLINNDTEEKTLILIPYQEESLVISNLLFPGTSQEIIKDLKVHLLLDLNNHLEKVQVDMVVLAANNEREIITRVIEIDYSGTPPFTTVSVNEDL